MFRCIKIGLHGAFIVTISVLLLFHRKKVCNKNHAVVGKRKKQRTIASLLTITLLLKTALLGLSLIGEVILGQQLRTTGVLEILMDCLISVVLVTSASSGAGYILLFKEKSMVTFVYYTSLVAANLFHLVFQGSRPATGDKEITVKLGITIGLNVVNFV